MERHADGFDDPLPTVHCHIVHGYEDVTSLGIVMTCFVSIETKPTSTCSLLVCAVLEYRKRGLFAELSIQTWQ